MLIDHPEQNILGLDLAIRTGSLVLMRVNHEYNVVERYKELYTWDRGPKIKDSLSNITEFFNRNIAQWFRPEFAEYVAVDWNLKEIYWSANKHNSTVKTFVAGYLMGLCHERGLEMRFIAPIEVRSFFGLQQKAKKEKVHYRFLQTPYIYKDKFIHYQTDHELDAAIVAYILDHHLRAIKRHQYDV